MSKESDKLGDLLMVWTWTKSVVDSRKPDQCVIITTVTTKTGQSHRDSANTNQFPMLLLSLVQNNFSSYREETKIFLFEF